MRLGLLLLALLSGACTSGRSSLTNAERRAIADTLEGMVKRAYDVAGPSAGAVERLLSLYPDSGRVISASGGRMLTSRDSLAAGIRYFWESVGRNMQDPRWVWEQMATDVLGRDAAVVTATYRVPHRTPRGTPHELAGAMTLVFARRGERWVVVQEHLSDRPATEESMSGMPADTAATAR
ncbi:MAG: nuclear transport factor 2 family protein [Gemmatimonadota bacterium]|nr:nuclear transport factor 2 family protein [Gemmatimonadota bacterium]